MKFLFYFAISLLLGGCFDSSVKECYEATKAVAESTEKSESVKDIAVISLFWKQAMYQAVIWRSKACKGQNAR